PRTLLAAATLVQDINTSTHFGPIDHLTAFNDMLLFRAEQAARGPELYRSDGTPSGTALLKDIRPGPLGSDPDQFTPAGTFLFFTANDGLHGTELWKTDRTP